MDMLASVLSIVSTLLAIAGLIGAAFAFRQAKKTELIKIKDETIDALQDQMKTIRDKQDDLERQNTRLENILATIQEALKKRGILVTIDGDLVSITEVSGVSTSYHKTTRDKKMLEE